MSHRTQRHFDEFLDLEFHQSDAQPSSKWLTCLNQKHPSALNPRTRSFVVSYRIVSSSLFIHVDSRGDPLHLDARSRQVVRLAAVVQLQRVLTRRVADLVGGLDLDLRDTLLVVGERLAVDVGVVASRAGVPALDEGLDPSVLLASSIQRLNRCEEDPAYTTVPTFVEPSPMYWTSFMIPWSTNGFLGWRSTNTVIVLRSCAAATSSSW